MEGSHKKKEEQTRERQQRQKKDSVKAKIKKISKDEKAALIIPGASHPDYAKIGWRWPKVFEQLKPFNLDKLAIVEQYRNLSGVVKLKRSQLKMDYQVWRISKNFSKILKLKILKVKSFESRIF